MDHKINAFFVGFDRDGTLEIPDYPMPQKLKRMIVDLDKVGAHIFFASGKSMFLLQNLVDEIGVKPWLICAENGGHIRDFNSNKESIFGKTEDLERFDLLIQNEKLPPHRYEDKVSIWSRKFGEHVIEAKEIIEAMISKNGLELSVFTYPDGDGGLDVVPPGIDKANLLNFIPSYAEIHYFGDSFNDLGIMQNARVVPHTVANAAMEVKKEVIYKGGNVAQYPAGQGVLSILHPMLETIKRQ